MASGGGFSAGEGMANRAIEEPEGTEKAGSERGWTAPTSEIR